MKGLLLIVVLTLLCTACSTTKFNSRSSIISNNVTADESLQRHENSELKTISLNKSNKSGVAACYLGNIDEGLKKLKDEFDISNKAPYWNQIGVCYHLKNEHEKALFYYNIALQKQSNYAPALNNVALIHVDTKNFGRAIRQLKSARVSAPSSNVIKINLANLYIKFGFHDRALGLLRPLYGASSKDTDILAAMATAYLMKNQLKTSQHYFRKITAIERAREDIACHYALSLYLSGRSKAAISTLEKIETSNHRDLVRLKKKIKSIIDKERKVNKNG